jgi:hypothetical protein
MVGRARPTGPPLDSGRLSTGQLTVDPIHLLTVDPIRLRDLRVSTEEGKTGSTEKPGNATTDRPRRISRCSGGCLVRYPPSRY